MRTIQAWRFALDPTPGQQRRLASHAGAARFAFNWGLALINTRHQERDRHAEMAVTQGCSEREARALGVASVQIPYSLAALRREWNAAKATVAPWWAENSKEAYSSGLDGLARAFKACFDSKAGCRPGPQVGWPKPKKRSHRRSCRFTTGALGLSGAHHVKLPRIGLVKTHEPTTALLAKIEDGSARVLSATVSWDAGRWFVSFTCERERDVGRPTKPDSVVGVDAGVRSLAVLSTGQVAANPKALTRYAKRMKRLDRQVSRRQRGSRRQRQSKHKQALCHAKVAHIRRDAMHKLTTSLAKTHGTVVVEHLRVDNLGRRPRPKPDPATPGHHLPNGRSAKSGLNRALRDAGMAELRRQLTYKCAWYGCRLFVAETSYPSSKLCSACGWRKPSLPLAERTFRCESCGLAIDRDLNAALNLKALGTGSGPGTGLMVEANAQGEERLQPDAGQCSSTNCEAGMTGTAVGQSTAA